MVERTRLSPQIKQGRRSILQIRERLEELGWVATRSDEDLGEDLMVDIYFEGIATGVLFYLQGKSVTNLLRRREGDYLPYGFEVKDLKHWEKFALPVVLMVWDVQRREGRWELLNQAIAELNRRLPEWRTNRTTARVHIPWRNTTDEAGFMMLRRAIGRHLYPLISRGRSPEVKVEVVFPGTEEGSEASKAFQLMLDEGQPLTLTGDSMQAITMDPWWTQWFGSPDQLRFVPRPADEVLSVNIGVISSTGEMVPMPNVELRKVNPGTRMALLTNEHQAHPLHFRFTLYGLDTPITVTTHEGRVDLSLNVNTWGTDAGEALRTIKFLSAVSKGGVMHLSASANGALQTTIDLPAQPEKTPPFALVELVEKLCLIQEKTQQFFRLPRDGPSDEEVRTVHDLYAVIQNGKVTSGSKLFTLNAKGDALRLILDLHRRDQPFQFTVVHEESERQLFDKTIPMGRMVQHFKGRPDIAVAELEQASLRLEPDAFMALSFVDAEIVELFPDWFEREARRLGKLLVEEFDATSVYLFGSLAWGDMLGPETDIDLAIKGLPADCYFKALAFLERESNFDVDLVELDRAPQVLQQRILLEGMLLIEREPVAAAG